ncbi:MAG TPA: hypothetical protein PK184_13085 [Phycisphaerae bacterium]|jgi:hypothetical protein|nr:hypothetical protein [Phycisphaerae bacterium]HPU33624.1 hypothetical protein [Phycisphaerae bacterium]
MVPRTMQRIGRLLPVGLLLLAAGCNAGAQGRATAFGGKGVPTTQQAMTDLERQALANTETRILDVVAYYPTPIRWIWTEDKSRVRGIVVPAVYLVGPKGKGVFGDGILRPKILVHDRLEPDPKNEWKLVKEWELKPVDLLLLRSKEPTIQGYGYMLPLQWGDIDLGGTEIQVVITYERSDGMPAPRFSSKYLRVPKKGA